MTARTDPWEASAGNPVADDGTRSILELRKVSKSYGPGPLAVCSVDLSIVPREFFSLLGPSGCGKTTILRMLAGFEVPTAGTILVDGNDFTHVPPYRRGMSMVFQNYALFPHRTVFENVAFGLRMRKIDRSSMNDKIAHALSMVALSGLENRKPSQLSGGQQQRVALARALVVEPKVLLCDEPFAALDKKLRQSMQIELKQLQRRLGVTLIFVTHDQEEALAMSDRIAVMNAGQIEQIGSPADIYNKPNTCFAADFIGDTNLLKGEAIQRDGRSSMAVNKDFSVALPVSDRVGKPIAAALRPEKVILSSTRDKAPSKATGVVESVVFQGQGVLFHVLIEGGQRLLVREGNDGGPLRFKVHEPVTLDWNTSEISLLWE